MRVEGALEDANVMMLRIKERMGTDLFPNDREYARMFGLDKERLSLADPMRWSCTQDPSIGELKSTRCGRWPTIRHPGTGGQRSRSRMAVVSRGASWKTCHPCRIGGGVN